MWKWDMDLLLFCFMVSLNCGIFGNIRLALPEIGTATFTYLIFINY